MPSWLNFLLQNIELLITGLGILVTVFFAISSVITTMNKANKQRQQELEKRRRRAQKELEQRESNPATQSYEAYLKRTEVSSRESTNTAMDSTQNSLRETLAQKMGRPSTKPSDEGTKSTQTKEAQALEAQLREPQAAIPRKLSPQRIQPRIEVSLDIPEAVSTAPARPQSTADTSRTDRSKASTASADRPRTMSDSFEFEPNDIVRATIWAEILSPPKARQGKGRATNRRYW